MKRYVLRAIERRLTSLLIAVPVVVLFCLYSWSEFYAHLSFGGCVP